MTSISERRAVFLDATVLAAPTTRSLVLFGQLHRDAGFVFRWSVTAEQEADRALERRAWRRGDQLGRTVSPVLVSVLREVLDWGADAIVPEAPELEAALAETSQDDRPVLAAAAAAGAYLVVTTDVDDFGSTDLDAVGVSAVNPDLFLAWVMTPAMYRFALERMADRRTLEPNTPESIHASLGKTHPRVVEAMRQAYPGVAPLPSSHRPPAELFRGSRCLVCGQTACKPAELVTGVCRQCRAKSLAVPTVRPAGVERVT
jgi:hypothetical protein